MSWLLALAGCYLLAGAYSAACLLRAGAPWAWAAGALIAWPVMAGWVLWLLLCTWRDD